MKSLATMLLFAASLMGALNASATTSVALPGMGLVLSLPDGWDTVGAVDSTGAAWHYMWFPKDTSIHVYEGVFLYEGLSADSDSVANWPYEMSYAQKLNVEFSACGGAVYSWTNYAQDGLAASYLNSAQSSGAFCDTTEAWHQRYFAYGTHGWEVYLEGDTAAVSTYYAAYTKILDSIKVDRSWAAGIAGRAAATSQLRARQVGGVLVVDGPAGADGWILDVQGRTWGRLALNEQGRGTAPLAGLPNGHYVLRASWASEASARRAATASFFVAR